MRELAPWASDPAKIKLEIVERLVIDKHQYKTALPIIAAMRQEGVDAPVLDLIQGIAMREEGLHGEAENLLLEARRRIPSDARVHEALCVLYADKQATDKAISACEKATKVDPERASGWNNLGYLYLVTDRRIEAVEAAERAVALNGSESRYRNNLAIAQVANKDVDGALQLFRTTGSEADAQYNVGFAMERFVDQTSALPWYRRALDAQEQHVAAARAIERIENPQIDSEESP